MKKKLIILMLAFILIGSSIFANGEKENKNDDGLVTIDFAIWDKSQEAGMQAMVDAFEVENPEIKVNLVYTPWAQYWTKLQAAGTGNSLPDVFWMHPEQVFTYTDGDKLLNLTPYIEKSSIADLSKFPSNIVGDFNVDGKQFGIPKDYATFGLWYNKDLFDAKGIAYPDETWDWNTLKKVAAELTDKDAGIYGICVQYNSNDAAYHYIWQNEGDIINKEETKSEFDDPNTIEAIEYMVDFINKGYSPTMADYASTTANQYFESGKSAMNVSGSWMCNEFLQIEGLNVDVAPLAKGKVRANLCGGMGYSVAASTKHPEEAWKFVEFLSSPEANEIQSASGAAISAYEGTQNAFVEKFPSINAQVFVDAASYGKSSQYCRTRSEWIKIEEDYMTQIFSGTLPVIEGCEQLATKINQIL